MQPLVSNPLGVGSLKQRKFTHMNDSSHQFHWNTRSTEAGWLELTFAVAPCERMTLHNRESATSFISFHMYSEAWCHRRFGSKDVFTFVCLDESKISCRAAWLVNHFTWKCAALDFWFETRRLTRWYCLCVFGCKTKFASCRCLLVWLEHEPEFCELWSPLIFRDFKTVGQNNDAFRTKNPNKT